MNSHLMGVGERERERDEDDDEFINQVRNSHVLFEESSRGSCCQSSRVSRRMSQIFDQNAEEDEELLPITQPAEISAYYKKKTQMDDRLSSIVSFLKKNWKLWLVAAGLFIFFLLLGLLSEPWKELQWRGWAAIAITCLMLLMLVEESLNPAFVFMIVQSLILLLYYTREECEPCTDDSAGQDCPPSRALQGFSNSGVLTVGILFVVAKGIELSSVLNYFIKYVLRKPSNLLDAQARLLIPVLIFSAFLNNTPVVAMMIPVIQNWAVQCRLNASYLLMPLSYAAIMGGTCSLIGTSSNVIIAGLVDDDPYSAQFFPNGVGFFSIAVVGVPAAVAGIIYILIFSRFLLPGNTESEDDNKNDESKANNSHDNNNDNNYSSNRESRGSLDLSLKSRRHSQLGSGESEVVFEGRQNFVLPILITKGSSLANHSLKDNGLDDMEGIFVSKIVTRGAQHVIEDENVSPDYIVKGGDTIYFCGNWDALQTVFALDGVVPATVSISQVKGRRYERCVVHVVLSSRSEFLGKTVSEIDTIRVFNAAVVAINRQDYPVKVNDLEDVVLCAGDVLVLETTTTFVKEFGASPHFALVSEKRSGSFTPRRVSFSMFFVCSLAVLMIALSASDVLNLLPGGFFVATVYILFGVMTWAQAKGAVNVDVLFVIAAAFALGNALQDTCAANTIAESLLDVFQIGGQMGVLVGLYLCVAMMSAVISNSACVTLMYPIAKQFSICGPGNSVVVSYEAAVFTLMLAGSACFATPIGYQTNLMVMSPGNYSTLDFIKFGVPITLINMVVVCVLIRFIWPGEEC